MNHKTIAVGAVVMVALLSGCATYKTTMTNAQGQSVTCEASGKSGIVTGVYLRQGFDACVADAKARGYTSDGTGTAPSVPVPAKQ
jgi:hypothetical protein